MFKIWWLTSCKLGCCIKPQWVGMSSDAMLLYIEFVADDLLVKLCQERLYHASNPVGGHQLFCFCVCANISLQFPFMQHVFEDHPQYVSQHNSQRNYKPTSGGTM